MLTKGWVYNILTTQTTCPSFIHTLSCYKQPPFVQPKSACSSIAIQEDALREKDPASPGNDSGNQAENSNPVYLEYGLRGRVWVPGGYVAQTYELLAH